MNHTWNPYAKELLTHYTESCVMNGVDKRKCYESLYTIIEDMKERHQKRPLVRDLSVTQKKNFFDDMNYLCELLHIVDNTSLPGCKLLIDFFVFLECHSDAYRLRVLASRIFSEKFDLTPPPVSFHPRT